MIKYLFLSVVVCIGLVSSAQDLDDLVFGNDSTLDIVTWNVEWFPKNGLTTVNFVAEIIEAIDADIIAFQEIDENYYFDQLMDMLPEYEGFVVEDEYSGLAYAYKSDLIEVNNLFDIYITANREFPRAPLLMEFTFMEEEYILINNHLKCCGDGSLDLTDAWDEETRRLDACILLDQYIDINYSNEKVIVLGDFNDVLEDDYLQNVFDIFLSDPDNYLFADIDIAEGPFENWSYPWWPSHLDHILITNELFDLFENELSSIETIRLDDYFSGGLNAYDSNVSDHRPVGIKLQPDNVVISVEEMSKLEESISIYPNPSKENVFIDWDDELEIESIQIYDIFGRKVDHYKLLNGQTSLQIASLNLAEGSYQVIFEKPNKHVLAKKLIVVD